MLGSHAAHQRRGITRRRRVPDDAHARLARFPQRRAERDGKGFERAAGALAAAAHVSGVWCESLFVRGRGARAVGLEAHEGWGRGRAVEVVGAEGAAAGVILGRVGREQEVGIGVDCLWADGGGGMEARLEVGFGRVEAGEGVGGEVGRRDCGVVGRVEGGREGEVEVGVVESRVGGRGRGECGIIRGVDGEEGVELVLRVGVD